MKNHNELIASLHDSLTDSVELLSKCTDMAHPSMTAVAATDHVAHTVKCIAKSLAYLSGEHEDHPEWGDADPEAKHRFMELEKHYMGFWRCAAAYKRSPTEENKTSMLSHFEHMLVAHSAMAKFVKGNCPALCTEITSILEAHGPKSAPTK